MGLIWRLRESQRNYLLVFVLLFFSGNPLANFLFGKATSIIALVITLILMRPHLSVEKKFILKYSKVTAGLLLLFFCQNAFLGFVSPLGILNFLMKIFTGGLIIHHLKDQFKTIFFKVVFHLCVGSLVFFLLINNLGLAIPKIVLSDVEHSYILYNTYEYHFHKNEGMFWEPGAFAGIITLCLALNFDNIRYYLSSIPIKLILVIITLLTTQSTTGYLSFFVLLIFYFIKPKNVFVLFIVLPILITGAVYVYENTEFLKEKIEDQYQAAEEQKVGTFSNTRFGSLMFDWHYIKKHPIIGNGMHERTRYADHLYLFRGTEGDAIGSGNGFSNYLASLGGIFIVGYFVLLYLSSKKSSELYGLIVLLVVLLNVQGEQWFNFAIYLGLVFLNLKGIVDIRVAKQDVINFRSKR